MRGRPLLRTIRLKPVDPSLLRSLLLALFFLAGSLVGYLCARSDSICWQLCHTLFRLYSPDFPAGVCLCRCGLDPGAGRGVWIPYDVHGLRICVLLWTAGCPSGDGGAHYPPSFYIAVLFCHGRSGMAAVYGVEYAHIWSWPAFGSSSVWEPLFYSLCVVCCDSYSWRFL